MKKVRDPAGFGLARIAGKEVFFLFGPRATGKSTLIRQQLADKAFVIDLLNLRNCLRFSATLSDLEAMIATSGRALVVIDEIERIPELLNKVHRLIETRGLRFPLKGSSARKLRRGQANLLAGRCGRHGCSLSSTGRSLNSISTAICCTEACRWCGCRQSQLKSSISMSPYLSDRGNHGRRSGAQTAAVFPFLACDGALSWRDAQFRQLANDCQVPPSTVAEYMALLEVR